ncbi:helix-turn-helix domain-containing protein [Paenibacillus sp. JJ-223]|uniref:helix-turn-helix domain-containing protein n=1 Tax=Paenibacillus sp. JJ-223 TaxID=2905647 RepID=UPI001F2B3B70|nr:helix-turn-helix domain-containing protein [Paenibacillus sp. JJ-223]CAH1199073.1 HTH-type transcriptional activator RhaS [Paenibacillus sp. JJ-223]
MKIIVVDDEKGIVEGLKKMIHRYIPECEIVGTAYNGLEGMDIIQKRKPDIVITDIRMPQAGGLEMIQALKQSSCTAKFILLSGYADFEYARTGMRLGVRFYMNKPVEEEELRDCVRQAIEEIRADNDSQQEMKQLKQEVLGRNQEEALRNILELGGGHAELVQELLQIAQIPRDNKVFTSMMIEFHGPVDVLKESGLEPLYQRIDLALKRYEGVYRFRYSGPQIAVLIAHGGVIGYGELVRSTRNLREDVHRNLNLSIAIGIGSVQERAEGIGQSFEEARMALSYKVIKGGSAVIPFTEIVNSGESSQPVPEHFINKLESALDNMEEAECTGVIREIFRWMEAGANMGLQDLQLKCLHILVASTRKMSFQQLQQNESLGRHILSLEGISRFRTLAELETWMIQTFRGIIGFKLEHHVPKKKDMITEMQEYIAEHYNQPLGLAELAARFYMNPYYLSQFFKQKTGETYLNFLTRIRIDKARELLENTDLKIYEICHKVGYSDAQHFARMFEKLTGCKPREYRKNLPTN